MESNKKYFRSRKCFSLQNESHAGKLLFCSFDAFLRKLIKKTTPLRSTKCFSHHNEPYTAKLRFSSVLKHFCGN